MKVTIRTLLILITVCPTVTAAPVERPPRGGNDAEASQYASQLLDITQIIATQYAREVERSELIIAALQGLYDAARQPFPTGLPTDIRATRNPQELHALTMQARKRLGNHPALEGNRAFVVSVQSTSRVLDPYCMLVPATDFNSPAEVSLGFGIDLDGEIGRQNIMRRNVPNAGFQLPNSQEPPPIPFRVARIHPGSPAQRAGLKPGDVISRIDDKAITAANGPELYREVLQGAVDPASPRQYRFEVLRAGRKEPLTFSIAQRYFAMESVYGVRRAEDNGWDWWLDREQRIACIRIGGIDPKTPGQLADALHAIRDAQALILDLRWCPGGFLNQSAEIAGLFMGAGKIASLKYRNPTAQGASEFSAGAGLQRIRFRDTPLLLLVNGDTSGGGELIACALQDNARARVAGTRTLGKASVQTPVYLPTMPNWTFRMTAGAFIRPSGKNLQRYPDSRKEDDWGVLPDKGFEIPISPALAERLRDWHAEHILRPGASREALPLDDPEADPQRATALRMIRKMMAEKQ